MALAHDGTPVWQTPLAVLALNFSQRPPLKPLVMPEHVSTVVHMALGQPPGVEHVALHVPTLPAWLHVPHGLVHAVSQHTPCGEQKPDVQSLGIVHAAPLAAAGAAHEPVTRHTLPTSQTVTPD